MSVKCKDIIEIMNKLAPQYLALKSDNTGLMLGNEESAVNSILVSLDINDDVYKEAVERGCSLVINHHPFIFHPLSRIDLKSPKGKLIEKLIAGGINVFSAHTNLDIAGQGINEYLSKIIGLTDVEVLNMTYEEKLLKLAVYVPREYAEKVRKAIMDAGAGYTGNYSCCTFNIQGKGTFLPEEGSSPFIGERGRLETVDEVKIETVIKAADMENVKKKVLESHPYEEPAIDIYPISGNRKYGLGRIGLLKNPVTLKELCQKVKDLLKADYLNVVGDPERIVHKVALCSGSGADYIIDAVAAGCDVYLTGDIKYHDACDARDMGLALIDGSHFATENIYMGYLADYLKNELEKRNLAAEVYVSVKNKSPFYKV